MKDVLVLTTGGTIASTKTENGLAPGLDAETLIGYFERRPGVNLSVESVMSKDSTNMQPEDWLDLATRIQQHHDNYDAFIITTVQIRWDIRQQASHTSSMGLISQLC